MFSIVKKQTGSRLWTASPCLRSLLGMAVLCLLSPSIAQAHDSVLPHTHRHGETLAATPDTTLVVACISVLAVGFGVMLTRRFWMPTRERKQAQV